MRSTRVLLSSIATAVLLVGATVGALAHSEYEPNSFPTGTFVIVGGTDVTIDFDEDGTGRGSSAAGGWEVPFTYATNGDLFTQMTFEWPEGSQTPATYHWEYDGEGLTFELWGEDLRPTRKEILDGQAYVRASSAIGVTGQSDATARPPIPSVGCGTSEVESGKQSGTIEVGGSELPWQLLVPSAHDGVTPTPLVVSLHGGGEIGYAGYSRFATLGEEQGFAVVAPEHSRYGAWMYWFEDTAVDLARVYATGWSGGAWGTAVLGCALEDRIAALAPVASPLDLGDACDLERPVPLVAFHGTADEMVLFEGGISQEILDAILPSGERWRDTPAHQADVWRVMGRSVPERIAGVAVRNGCDPEPTSEGITDDLERLTWACPKGAEVELVAIDGGTHVWPTLPKVDASELIWGFFAKHALPE